jgi:hypothetical protein
MYHILVTETVSGGLLRWCFVLVDLFSPFLLLHKHALDTVLHRVNSRINTRGGYLVDRYGLDSVLIRRQNIARRLCPLVQTTMILRPEVAAHTLWVTWAIIVLC